MNLLQYCRGLPLELGTKLSSRKAKIKSSVIWALFFYKCTSDFFAQVVLAKMGQGSDGENEGMDAGVGPTRLPST